MRIGNVKFSSVLILCEGEEYDRASKEGSIMISWPVKYAKPYEGDDISFKGISPVRKGVVHRVIYQIVVMRINGREMLHIAYDKVEGV